MRISRARLASTGGHSTRASRRASQPDASSSQVALATKTAAILPEFWGQGLATEGARACLRFGFEEVGLDRIIGVTNPANAPSRRVLEKAGFIYQGLREYHAHESAWYALERAGS